MKDEPTHQPHRVLVGFCPECPEVVVVFNNLEVWPLVRCKCGWVGDTLAIKNKTRYERGGKIFDAFRPDPFTSIEALLAQEPIIDTDESFVDDAQHVEPS